MRSPMNLSMICPLILMAVLLAGTLVVGQQASPAPAAPMPPVQILMSLTQITTGPDGKPGPGPRLVYQTNERIYVSVPRSSDKALAAGELVMTLTADDGGKIELKFPVQAVAVQGTQALRVEHLSVNGRLLRPGKYAIEVACDGAKAQPVNIEVVSHIRRSLFSICRWMAPRDGAESFGEDNQGFNLQYANYGGNAYVDRDMLGGTDFMQICAMGGGHQMALSTIHDWSDPYVMNGGAVIMARQALTNRTVGNCIGVHMFDEPGLTWWPGSPIGTHDIKPNLRSYTSAFDQTRIDWQTMNAADPATMAHWQHWGKWKLGFLEAAWRLARYPVDSVNPNLLAVNQHMYAPFAYADGYYFNVGRGLSVLNGHGGYDSGAGYYPMWFYDFGVVRDRGKPAWYMPTFTNPCRTSMLRLEHYLSFMHGAQGVQLPFWSGFPYQYGGQTGLVESNKLLQKIGTIFNTMQATRPKVGLLWSMSQNLYAQANNPADNYTGGGTRYNVYAVYYAAKKAGIPLDAVVEEDILDGTVAANHTALIIPTVDYLEPKVVAALEAYISAGGHVLLSEDSKVQVKGAEKFVPVARHESPWGQGEKAFSEGRVYEFDKILSNEAVDKFLRDISVPMKQSLAKYGITPPIECENEGMFVNRHVDGDIEYLFIANSTPDRNLRDEKRATTKVTLGFPQANGRKIYDIVRGGEARELAADKSAKYPKGEFRFGAGQMRAFALTARPVGGVQAITPVLERDFTKAVDPIHVKLSAALVDEANRVLSGSVPMQIKVIDPNGALRYDVFRAAEQGVLKLSLPLAANDPAGTWRVVVKELLTNKTDETKFEYTIGGQCPAVAGQTRRAVYFGNDREKIFKFFRTFHDVTVIYGSNEFDKAAAERVARDLKPWDIKCTLMSAADANKPRLLEAEEVESWVGADGGYNKLKPGTGDFLLSGCATRGPTILIGSPADNPLIARASYLPFATGPTMPGPGRGMIAWTRDNVSFGNESVVCVGYDAAGLGEAVGTMYEACAALEPLTEFDLPTFASVAAGKATLTPQFNVVSEQTLVDRIVGAKPLGGGATVILTADGTLTAVDASGKTMWQNAIDGGEEFCMDTSADGGLIAVGATHRVVGFDRGGKQLFDFSSMSQGTDASGFKGVAITSVAVSPDGQKVAAVGEKGRILLISGGKVAWEAGGIMQAEYDAWQAEFKAWIDAKPARDAAMKAFQEAWALSEKAREEWKKAGEQGDAPKRPQRPEGMQPPVLKEKPTYTAAMFTADGSTLAVTIPGKLTMLDAANGQQTEEMPADYAPVRVGGDLVFGMHGKLLGTYSPQQKKVTATMEGLPWYLVAQTSGEYIVGSQNDYTVRKLKGFVDKAKLTDQAAWEHKIVGKLPKQIVPSGDRIAVAYWGGTVEILDGDGKTVARQLFDADVSAITWIDKDTLMATFSDGYVRILKN